MSCPVFTILKHHCMQACLGLVCRCRVRWGQPRWWGTGVSPAEAAHTTQQAVVLDHHGCSTYLPIECGICKPFLHTQCPQAEAHPGADAVKAVPMHGRPGKHPSLYGPCSRSRNLRPSCPAALDSSSTACVAASLLQLQELGKLCLLYLSCPSPPLWPQEPGHLGVHGPACSAAHFS